MAEATVVGLPVHGPHGEQIGVVTRVYRDEATGYPEWISVRVRGREHVVPVGPTQLDADRVAIAFDTDAVEGAPQVGSGEHLSVEDHRLLVRHYGLDRTNEDTPRVVDRSGEPGAGHVPSERLEHGSSAD
jgi:PRC-barrel domain